VVARDLGYRPLVALEEATRGAFPPICVQPVGRVECRSEREWDLLSRLEIRIGTKGLVTLVLVCVSNWD
jgi:hypothetical protein